MAEYEYLWAPGTSGQWIPFEELSSILRTWDSLPMESGFPSVTISKRVKEEVTECGDVHLETLSRCRRPTGHTGLHADHEDIGHSKRGWSRT